jgi:IclR family KDG regulon transcriptional repressor
VNETVRRSHSTLSSVQNAARVLKEYSKGTRDLGVTELSRRLGVGKSTAHRLVNTLALEGILEQDPHTGTYRLGLVMYELGASVALHADLHEACSPVIDHLRNATKETVQIAVLDSREVVYVERRESPQTLRLFGRVGFRNDAHCTSTGKLLLASLPPHVLETTLNGWRLKQHTPHTIVRIDKLRAELSNIRKNGWAENNNESEMGVASVAAPVRNGMGEVIAAVSVAGPVQRLTGDSLRRFARPCIEAGVAISRRLGYHEKPKGR